MATPETVLGQDLEAISLAFKKKDFPAMNIFANRLTSNAYLASADWAAVTGYLLKDVAIDSLNARPRKEAQRSLEPVGSELIERLREQFSQAGDLKKRWQAYFNYVLKARRALMDDVEKEAYRDSPDFVRASFVRLGRLLSERWRILLDPKNMFIAGILNEMSRLIRAHGAAESEIATYVTLKAFGGYYDYLFLSSYMPDGALNVGIMEPDLKRYIERLERLFSSPAEPENLDLSMANSLFSELIFEWRRFFLLYMEQPALQPAGERRKVELPEEAKRKIAEIISEALKREVKID